MAAYRWKCLLLLLVAGWFAPGAVAQRGNPFEITSRLPAERPGADSNGRGEALTPFDVRRGAGGVHEPAIHSRNTAPRQGTGLFEDQPASSQNRREASVRRVEGPERQAGPLVIRSTDPNKGKGSILAIQLLLLVALACLWVLFGGLLRQCLRGAVNDGLMSQIYTRRSSGEESALWLCYLFFFFSAGFFVYLTAAYHDVHLNLGVFAGWLTYTLAVAGALGLKQLILWAIGRLFPVRKETSRYAFVLMVFCILVGVVLVPVNLGISYAPENWRSVIVYGSFSVLVLVYLMHFARGMLIAGRLTSSRPLHLLLYICAIEIAPFLLLYRYLTDALI